MTPPEPPAKATVCEIVPPDTAAGFAAMVALRPHLVDVASFVRQVDEDQRPQGYRLVGVFTDAPQAHAVAGFRVSTNTAFGRFCYVDDLSTLPSARRLGYGRLLLDWVHAEAVRQGAGQVHLDSGVGENRQSAHRLYFNTGYRIASYHFSRKVD